MIESPVVGQSVVGNSIVESPVARIAADRNVSGCNSLEPLGIGSSVDKPDSKRSE